MTTSPSETGKVALLWDESFLWGLIAYDVFSQLGINFELLGSRDIKDGALEGFDVLFVPGGWASNKSKALGEAGRDNIRRFVEIGGGYVGFCGGAGLALQNRDGLGLVPITRKPTGERVPSFSGKIQLHQSSDHPIWAAIPDGASFYAWWPGQFSISDDSGVTVLASYGRPEVGSYMADIPVHPLIDWELWEESYHTNLNPARIEGEPAVLEANFGAGKILLSYPHFETPGDELGHKVLVNMLAYAAGKRIVNSGKISASFDEQAREIEGGKRAELILLIEELVEVAQGFIEFGEENFLWRWRNSWILLWRRGVRGIEYCTLYVLLARLSELLRGGAGADAAAAGIADEELAEELGEIEGLCLTFFAKAKRLLLLERYAMNYGPISPLHSDNEEIALMRDELFANSKRFGGFFKQIIDKIDALLFRLLR